MTNQKELIFGCMGLGGNWNHDPFSYEDEKVATKAIEAAISCGITKFDHANIYKFGKSEEVFGKVLKTNPCLRKQMWIQTKAGIVLGAGPNGSNIYNNSKEYLINQVKKSIERLQIDYLDCFLIHRADPLMEAEEIADAFYVLKKEGLVQRFGVSNMSVGQIQWIQKYWEDPLYTNQIQFSLGHSSLVDLFVNVNMKNKEYDSSLGDILNYCKLNHMTIQAWGPLDQGKFLQTIEKGNNEQMVRLLDSLALKYDVSRSAILLAWILRIPFTIQPIIGTNNPLRIKESKAALTINLSREDWYSLWITAKEKSLP